MKQDESVRGLWRRAAQAHGFLLVDQSSRRIPWFRDGQAGKEDQSSFVAKRASGDIDAGELEHQLVN
jgi:hypothetical protein